MRPVYIALAAAVAACAEPLPDPPAACAVEERRSIGIPAPRALDLLVVMDRTASMDAYGGAVAVQVHELANVLATLQGGLPDLHLAVVTSDMGGADVPGCTAEGDAGAFVSPARCGVEGAYLHDGGPGARNFLGMVGDAWACLVDTPPSACPVSQPLAAIVAALDGSVPTNDGFRRPWVDLAVLVITDGDDCSLIDAEALAGIAGEAAVDARCTTLGAGLADVGATMSYLRTLLSDRPDRLVLATVSGRVAPRLRAASLSDRSAHADIDEGNWSDVLVGLPTGWWGEGGNPCFDGAIDRLPEVPGIQAECAGVLGRVASGGVETSERVPWCTDADHAPGTPCLRFVRDEQRCPTQPIAVALEHDPTAFPGGAVLDVRCATDCR